MNSSPDDSESPEAVWARSQLDLPVGYTSDDLRGQFLRQATSHLFVPNEDCCDAFAILSSNESPASLTAKTSRIHLQRLRAEIEQFARNYFSYPSPDRTEVWQSLVRQSSDDAVAQARLRGLQRGLHVDFDREMARQLSVGQLALQIADIVVARPAEAVAMRHGLLTQHRQDTAGMVQSARGLFATYRNLADLEADLLARLSSSMPAQIPMRPIAAPQAEGQKKDFSFVWVLVILIIASSLLRLLNVDSSSSQTSPDPAEIDRLVDMHRDADGDFPVFVDENLTIVARGTSRLAKRKPEVAAARSDDSIIALDNNQSTDDGDPAGTQPSQTTSEARVDQKSPHNEVVLIRATHVVAVPLGIMLEQSHWNKVKISHPQLWDKLLAWSRHEIVLTENDLAPFRGPANRKPRAGSSRR